MRNVYKSAIRDLFFHKGRSAVILLAVIMVISFSLALNSLTTNLENSLTNEQGQYKLAHVNFIFSEMTDPSINQTITEAIHEAIGRYPQSSNIRYYLNSRYQLPDGEWIENVILSMDKRTPEPLNQILIEDGRKPVSEKDVFLLSSFAKEVGIEVGDTVTLFSPVGSLTYTVVGMGKSIEFASYSIVQSGVMFLSDEGVSRYLGIPSNATGRNSFTYYIDEAITVDEETEIVLHVQEKLKEEGFPPVAFSWLMREVSYRKSLNDSMKVTARYMGASTLFIFLIAGVVIFVVTNRYVNDQKIIIGAMYSFGMNKREIISSFILRITILFAIGSAIGYFFGQKLLEGIISSIVDQWGLFGSTAEIPFETGLWIILGSYAVLILFNIVALFNVFRLTPYEAMRGKTSELKSTGLLFRISKILPSRVFRAAWRNLTRNRTRSALTIISFSVSLIFAGSILLTYTSVFSNVDDYFDNNVHADIVAHSGFEDAFGPVISELENHSQIIEVEPYLEILAQIKGRPDIVTFLRGLKYNSSMFDIVTVEGKMIKQGSNEILVSQYVRANFGYDIGDEVQVVFFDTILNFTVAGIYNDLYRTSSIFFDLDYLSKIVKEPTTGLPLELFGLEIYNKVLIKATGSIHDLVDELNKEYPKLENALSIEVQHRIVRQLIGTQTIVIFVIVFLALGVGSITVFTTQFISLIERDREFSVLRIFGSFDREILNGVLVEATIIGTFSVLAAVILSGVVANVIWIPLISESLLYVTLANDPVVLQLLLPFAAISVYFSTLVSFRESVKIKPAEAIRFEFL